MDPLAREYVRLVLALGKHDPNYVDAYYGPPEWRETELPLPEIRVRASETKDALAEVPSEDPMDEARRASLGKQLDSLVARAELVGGVTRSFDEESTALYDVVASEGTEARYKELLDQVESLLPGEGSAGERYDRLRQRFLVPPDRLAAVFDAAIEAARARTKEYITLPEGENFRTEYVKGEVWGAYNWYQGNAQSLIQVNTDLPQSIHAPLHLACHEGYPGHHVYNALLERELARGRDWVEFTVYPLYSPQSLIAEGTAEYGFELAFPEGERQAFERETLYPLAGLDSGGADEYDRAVSLVNRLGGAVDDAARRFLDGQATREETQDWLVTYGLLSPERASQRIRFIEAHRSYVVTYRTGLGLVRDYVEAQASSTEAKWDVFRRLLSTPQTPSALKIDR